MPRQLNRKGKLVYKRLDRQNELVVLVHDP